jgi:hypothetical protein
MNKPKVIVCVRGGMVDEVIREDTDIEIEIRDYDTEGQDMIDAENILTDEDGEEYSRSFL